MIRQCRFTLAYPILYARNRWLTHHFAILDYQLSSEQDPYWCSTQTSTFIRYSFASIFSFHGYVRQSSVKPPQTITFPILNINNRRQVPVACSLVVLNVPACSTSGITSLRSLLTHNHLVYTLEISGKILDILDVWAQPSVDHKHETKLVNATTLFLRLIQVFKGLQCLLHY